MAIWVVNALGGDDYLNPVDALANASTNSGDIIEIKNTAVYSGSSEVFLDGGTHNKTSITFRAHSANGVDSNGNPLRYEFDGTGVASGFKCRDSWIIEDCYMHDYTGEFISSWDLGTENLQVRNCYLLDGGAYAIRDLAGSSIIERNIIENFTTKSAILRDIAGATVRNNLIINGCATSGGFDVIGGQTGDVLYNTLVEVKGTGAGILHGPSGGYRCDNNLVVADSGSPGTRGIEGSAEDYRAHNYVHGGFTGVGIGTSGNVSTKNPTERVTTAGPDAPIFVNAAGGNYHQTSASPASRKGRYISTVLVDLENVTRDASIIFDKCIGFDGTEDYTRNQGLAAALLASDYSISGWIKPSTATDTNRDIMGFVTSGGSNVFSISMFAIGGPEEYLRVSTASAALQGTDDETINVPEAWIHIAVTYDEGTRETKAYVNDTIAWTVTLDGTYPGLSSDDAFWVGRANGTGTTEYWRGRIHNVSVWNKVLDQADVTEIWNEGIPLGALDAHTSRTNLKAWWKMGTGDTFPTLQDSVLTYHLTMDSMDASNINTSDHFYGMSVGAYESQTLATVSGFYFTPSTTVDVNDGGGWETAAVTTFTDSTQLTVALPFKVPSTTVDIRVTDGQRSTIAYGVFTYP